MMRQIICLAALLIVSGLSFGGLVEISDFSGEYAGYVQEDNLQASFTDNVNLLYTFVHSTAYTNGENYVYLYQVTNMNFTKVLHRFSAADFDGLSSENVMGYLSANSTAPLGFMAGGIEPVSGDMYGKTFGFAFELLPMRYSAVFVVESPYAPSVITGYLQNGGQSWGDVLGATIPEPASLGLLMVGTLFAWRKRRQ
ncbi:MAG: PEP-CTERM sorting domain-containing protein [Anaerohalosphaeraceae bacterium]